MSPVAHAAVSGIVSAVFAFQTRSVPATAVCFLSGIFIDLDHVLDYWAAKRRLTFSYQRLFSFCAKERSGKLFLIFHSVEFVLILWAVVILFALNDLWLGLAVGLSAHLAVDLAFNPSYPWSFVFFYRMKHGFTKKSVFKPDYFKNKMT